MSPRKYDLGKRAASMAETRRRIVEATLALHAEKGIAATRWEDIAVRAGVGVGTVYRHFPSLDELVPACGDVAMDRVALPPLADLPALFAGVPAPGERIARLVREAFELYDRAAGALRAIRREAGVHPRVAEDRDAVEAVLDALVDAALGPLAVTDLDRAVARAMVDLDTWEAFRGRGLDADSRVEAVAGMLAARIAVRSGDGPSGG